MKTGLPDILQNQNRAGEYKEKQHQLFDGMVVDFAADGNACKQRCEHRRHEKQRAFQHGRGNHAQHGV